MTGGEHEHGPEGRQLTSMSTGARPAAACASVALDIGAGYGALMLYPSARFRGREIEISPAEGGGHASTRACTSGPCAHSG